MGPQATQSLEIFITSEMGTPRWAGLRAAAAQAVAKIGQIPLVFESIPPGPIEDGFTVSTLGPDWAGRADMVIAIIGGAISEPVALELKAAWDRTPRPPIGFFFDSTRTKDGSVQELRSKVKDKAVIADFKTERQLAEKVGSFVALHSATARRNLGTARVLHAERVSLDPGHEVRRAFLLARGDKVVASAEAEPPRQKFHFALVDGRRYVELTGNQPWTEFDPFTDRFAFRREFLVSEPGYVYAIVRRPWWFQLGAANVRFSLLLTERAR